MRRTKWWESRAVSECNGNGEKGTLRNEHCRGKKEKIAFVRAAAEGKDKKNSSYKGL